MGDFNLDSPQENAEIGKCGLVDIWPILRKPEEESFTMKATSRFSAWRPDHFCVSQNSHWKPSRIERIGTEPIPLYQTTPV